MSKKLLALGSVVVSAALLAGPAFAGALGSMPTPPKHAVVYRTNLNLATRDGATRELSSIDRAAQGVCGGPPLPSAMKLTLRYDQCYEGAIRSAVTKANLPKLTTAYANSSRMGYSETTQG